MQELRDELDARTAAHAQKLLHMNQMLVRSTRFCRAITDAVPAQVAYWERGGVCRFANRAFRDWVGRDPEETLGRTRAELYAAEDEAVVQRRLDAALQGHDECFEVTLRGVGGRRAAFRMHFVPAFGRDHTVHGVYSIAFEAGAGGAPSA